MPQPVSELTKALVFLSALCSTLRYVHTAIGQKRNVVVRQALVMGLYGTFDATVRRRMGTGALSGRLIQAAVERVAVDKLVVVYSAVDDQ